VEQAHEAGLASNSAGGYLAGMGVACGDLDGDGRLDLAVTNFLGESTTLYHNHGDGLFTDRTAAAGLAAPTRFVLGFGLAMLDSNNDGHLDLAQANGHIGDYRPANPYAMPAQLFLGDGTGKLVEVSGRAGAPWAVERLARGLATGDLDNDGRVDVVLVSQNAPLAVLHNQPGALAEDLDRDKRDAHFVVIELEGKASNRDAIGAKVVVTVAGLTQFAERFGGGSYASASDKRLHFGLGANQVVDRIEVIWPSGQRDRFEHLAADTGYRLLEGSSTAIPLPGFRSLPPASAPRP
jgi:enediyne biosynthesis protein E4